MNPDSRFLHRLLPGEPHLPHRPGVVGGGLDVAAAALVVLVLVGVGQLGVVDYDAILEVTKRKYTVDNNI